MPAIVLSQGEIVSANVGWSPAVSHRRVRLYGAHYYTYSRLYREQPNVRTCVDFLARNIAQLGLHVFRRIGETDRKRLRDHGLARVIERPNPFTTRYRLIESLMSDLGIYWNAYWLKIRAQDKTVLVRVPPELVTVKGGLGPESYTIDMGARRVVCSPAEVVHFRGYNPDSPSVGYSALETLRRILAEELAMGQYREGYWENAARMSGLIERPVEAPEWSKTARDRFLAEFEALYAGEDNSGKTAVLEEGMTWKETSFSPRDSEYLAGRKLTREECARAYHIPLPMVGILDKATFSNIKEQHKNLYQDCLGPWLKMIEEDVELQLLPDFGDTEGVYCEFNIQEKLAGSFEEQMQSLQSAIGRPWMTANEGRARMNLTRMDGDADQLVTPLNVLVGGQASPTDSVAKASTANGVMTKVRRGQIDPTLLSLRDRHIEQWRRALIRTFERQRDAVMSRTPKKAPSTGTLDRPVQGRPRDKTAVLVIEELWDAERWNSELLADYYRLNHATATVWAEYMGEQMGTEIDVTRMEPWLAENARISAENINTHTQGLIVKALVAEVVHEAVAHVFELAIGARSQALAVRAVTTASVFGSQTGARQSGLRTKTWQVNSGNPRPEHALLDGETVDLDESFSNGMLWPGDPAGGADNNANCQCSVTFGRQ